MALNAVEDLERGRADYGGRGQRSSARGFNLVGVAFERLFEVGDVGRIVLRHVRNRRPRGAQVFGCLSRTARIGWRSMAPHRREIRKGHAGRWCTGYWRAACSTRRLA